MFLTVKIAALLLLGVWASWIFYLIGNGIYNL